MTRGFATRRARSGRTLVTAAAAALALSCAPQPLSNRSVPATAPATVGYAQGDPVPAHDTFTLASAAVGEERRINVYLPPQYRASGSATRLPVLYMPDGGVDEDFPHVANTVDSLIALGRIRPLLVVGIPNTERRRDLTGPTRVDSDREIAPRVGGSAAFRRFLRDELIPEVQRRYRVSGERGILGESLAGLFVVETFLTEPELFTHYIAFDPSLWWNGGALADSASERIAENRQELGACTLYFASSGEERGSGSSQLAAALRAAAPPDLRWSYEPRAELTHATIFRALKPRALVDAFR